MSRELVQLASDVISSPSIIVPICINAIGGKVCPFLSTVAITIISITPLAVTGRVSMNGANLTSGVHIGCRLAVTPPTTITTAVIIIASGTLIIIAPGALIVIAPGALIVIAPGALIIIAPRALISVPALILAAAIIVARTVVLARRTIIMARTTIILARTSVPASSVGRRDKTRVLAFVFPVKLLHLAKELS
jgi:hypothetical protein